MPVCVNSMNLQVGFDQINRCALGIKEALRIFPAELSHYLPIGQLGAPD
jgi:hypothetical protein